jgi:hypothetical protein
VAALGQKRPILAVRRNVRLSQQRTFRVAQANDLLVR